MTRRVVAGGQDLTILEQAVTDWPRFPFRAVLIDTGRHYLPVAVIQAHIDAMACECITPLNLWTAPLPSAQLPDGLCRCGDR